MENNNGPRAWLREKNKIEGSCKGKGIIRQEQAQKVKSTHQWPTGGQ